MPLVQVLLLRRTRKKTRLKSAHDLGEAQDLGPAHGVSPTYL